MVALRCVRMQQSDLILLSMKRVLELVPVSKTELYRKINAGEFPKPVPIGRQRVGFVEAEVFAWIDQCIKMRDEGVGAEARRQRAIRAARGR